MKIEQKKTITNIIEEKELYRIGFYKPFKDQTNKVDFMRYTNNCLSYGYNQKENIFYLCESPRLECTILKIISKHENFELVRKAHSEYKQKLN